MSVAGITETVQYLTFKLAEEIFAFDVAKVREILELTSITKVPQTPDFMRGVINLRGSVVPVIDLRLNFGMQCTEQTVNTCIIVVEVNLNREILVLGVLADSVQEVVEMEPDHIEPPPQLGAKLNTEFIKGMGKVENTFVMILDIDKVFSSEELSDFQGNTAA
ncbi:chemotaxis protein CheW [Desulfobulbus sp.]|uniref:chemotaxis protein CheW n=1 Tax=Desulfobulbus sp. TaxID=895 RepID=UPI0027B9CE37|nr:chemotaxis protein CheW [Desulfobulbus sp.]